MKRATREDYYRRAFDSPSILGVTSFQLIDGPTTGSLRFQVNGRITVLCGANGSGKTTVLEAMANLFEATTGTPVSRGKTKLESASAEAAFKIGDREFMRRCKFSEGLYQDCVGERAVDVVYLDPAERAREISTLLRSQEKFDELIASIGAAELDAKQRGLFSYVLHRDYDRFEIYEIEEYESIGTFPYFVVESDGLRYDSMTLGLGELTAMLTLWELRRLSNDPTILILEEPETHLSANSQSALVDAIVMFTAIRRKLNVVISTHSANIVGSIPNTCIKYLVRTGRNVTVVEEPSDLALEQMLGKTPRFRGIVLLEDELATIYLLDILRRFDHELLQMLNLVKADGASGIAGVLSNFPTVDWLKTVGMFDADQKDDATALNAIASSPHHADFLPGSGPIESQFFNLAKSNPERLAASLHKTEDELAILLSSLGGLEPHDWFKGLAASTALSWDALTSIFLTIQLDDDATSESIRQFVANLRARVSSGGR